MGKERDDIQDLKRRLSLLDRLDAGALVCADGVFLVERGPIADPRPLVKACEAGRPTSAAVRAAMGAGPAPIAIGAHLLAAAHRDLRAVESTPRLREIAREAPRIFRRFGELDETWLAHKRARLALLAELVRESEAPPRELPARADGAPPWFARVLDLVRLAHGDDAVAAVEGALHRLADGARAQRAGARRALAEVIAALEGKREPGAPAAADAARALREAGRLAGRSRMKRVTAVLRALLGGDPAGGEHAGGDAALPLVEQVRAAGERLIEGLPRPQSPAYRERATRFFASWALVFDPRPRDGGALTVKPEQVDAGLARIPEAFHRLAGRKIRLGEALSIASLGLEGSVARSAGRLVEAGLPIAKVERLAALSALDHATELDDDPRAAEAYADWAIALTPHYRALGLSVPITPEMFSTFRGARREDLAVLAVCLMKHHGRAGPEGAERAAARLDATLGLFRRRPAEAATVLAELTGTSPGAGREAFPDFAAWLGDDALLDRAVHLMRLAGLPVAISHSVRADFDRRAAQDRERAHLRALASPSPEQRERLARLDRGEVAVPDPARTRRRLAERVEELHAVAYEARLASVFRGMVKEVWGISLARLTPAWSDAIRFSFAVDDNRELLGGVLRAASNGLDLDRGLPANRAWIAEAAARFDVEAWLAPRRRAVSLDGEPYTLAIELDPIEVLRMGIPFGTCLSLEGGGNAASTVINAADANKRVIYLRDRAGKIVARKLIAVSTEGAMIGYRLYVAEKKHEAAIESAFAAMCEEIAREARLPLASLGAPKQIHPGFWYDDGTTPFLADPRVPGASVDAYCRALGRPPPRAPSGALRHEAAAFDALGRGDPAVLEAALGERACLVGPARRAATSLLAGKTPAEVVEIATRLRPLGPVAVELAAERGALEMLDLTGRLAHYEAAETAARALVRFPRTAEIASAIVAAGLTSKRTAPHFDDHGFEHQTMYLLPAYAGEIPIAAALSLCDRAAPLWAWVVEQSDGCGMCKISAEYQVIAAIRAGYARSRDPEAVMRCLESPRSSLLARRAALDVAAAYSLAEDGPLPRFPPPCLQPVRACSPAMRALARARQRAPEIEADPNLFAALLRQSAGALPYGVTLPAPSEAPFRALGDLILQLDLEAALAPWLEVKGAASSWEPTEWELAFHRRRPTARRAALVAEAAAAAPDTSPASDLLAKLGDQEALRRLAPVAPEPPKKRPARGARGDDAKRRRAAIPSFSRALDVARCIAEQVAAAGRPAFAIETASVKVPVERLWRAWEGIDPGLVTAAFTAAARALDDPGGDRAGLFAAYVTLLDAAAPAAALRQLVEEIVAPAAVGDEEDELVAGFLRERTTHGCPEVGVELAIAIARHGQLRRPLFAALARRGEERLEPFLGAFLAEARRAGGDALEEAVFTGLVQAVMDLGGQTLADLREPALYRRAVAKAIEVAPPSKVIAIFEATTNHEQASLFLEELSRSPARGTTAMRTAAGVLAGRTEDPDDAVRWAWLAEVMKAKGEG